MYKLTKIVGSNNFSAQFIKTSSNYQKIGYNIYVLQQHACLVVNPIRVDFLFIVTPIVGVCNCSMFCCTFFFVHSSIAIILMGKRKLLLCSIFFLVSRDG